MTICARRLSQERCDAYRRVHLPSWKREPPFGTFLHGHAETVAACGASLLVIRQRLRHGWEMPCTVEDVLRLLTLVPRAWWRDVRFLILRQPTRRERGFDACVVYWLRARGQEGTAIVMNAVEGERHAWVRRPRELDTRVALRLGAVPRSVPTGTHVRFPRDAARAFMLYHVLPHEIGHLVVGSDEERCERFAVELERRLRTAGAIPFGPRADLPDPPTRRHGWEARVRARYFMPGSL